MTSLSGVDVCLGDCLVVRIEINPVSSGKDPDRSAAGMTGWSHDVQGQAHRSTGTRDDIHPGTQNHHILRRGASHAVDARHRDRGSPVRVPQRSRPVPPRSVEIEQNGGTADSGRQMTVVRDGGNPDAEMSYLCVDTVVPEGHRYDGTTQGSPDYLCLHDVLENGLAHAVHPGFTLHPAQWKCNGNFQREYNIVMLKHEPIDGYRLRLEPLRLDHAAPLHAVTDPDVFRYFTTWPVDGSLDAMQAYLAARIANPTWHSYVMIDREAGTIMGCSAFTDLRTEHRGVEIGGTWIARPYQGTWVNPEAKYLMMRHAFEDMDMVRVQLKCDGRNLHSQRAIAKLGATREGVLRRHMILQDGFIRDTVMFSVTDREWPQVKAGLEERLGYRP